MHTLVGDAAVQGPAVLIDLDSVLLAVHQGKRGVELGVQPDLEEPLERLAGIAPRIAVLVEPPPAEPRRGLETERRLDIVRDSLGAAADDLLIVTCPHGEDGTCNCARPSVGLIEVAIEKHDLRRRGAWYIGGDQESIAAARTAGLRTIRIGGLTEDHLSAVHRADYEARDLLDAANHIMLQALA
ncbi:MAG: HAD hydrolase-like protein [Chloroflexota bacterium]